MVQVQMTITLLCALCLVGNHGLLAQATAASTSASSSTSSSSNGLQIIGAGFGRTGTNSLKEALNLLGYKTYHMHEIVFHPWRNDFDAWIEYYQGKRSLDDLTRQVFERNGYTASLDHPSCDSWTELAEHYPNAKIILTERSSPEKYWDSASQTTLIFSWPMRMVMATVPFFGKMKHLSQLTQRHTFFDNDANKDDGDNDYPQRLITEHDKDLVMKVYQENSDKVRRLQSQNPDRVLVYHVQDGWEPLCTFLGVPVPENTPFPKTNSRLKFTMNFVLLLVGVCAVGLFVLASVLWSLRKLTVDVVTRRSSSFSSTSTSSSITEPLLQTKNLFQARTMSSSSSSLSSSSSTEDETNNKRDE